jgi:hypothetical protein
MNLMFILASLKALTNSKTCSESRIRISVQAFALTGQIFSSVHTYMTGLRKNFQDHGRLSEQLLE